MLFQYLSIDLQMYKINVSKKLTNQIQKPVGMQLHKIASLNQKL